MLTLVKHRHDLFDEAAGLLMGSFVLIRKDATTC